MSTDRYQEGLENTRRHYGSDAEKYLKTLRAISPEFEKINVEWAFCDIYGSDILDDKTRELLALAALSCMGYPTGQIKVHVQGALNCGATAAEILEVIRMMVAYAGFPPTTNALIAAGEVLQEHHA